MHNINLNEKLLLKDQRPSHPFTVSKGAINNAGFKPRSPNLQREYSEKHEKIDKNLKKDNIFQMEKEEILEKTLGKSTNYDENTDFSNKGQFKKANKTEICDSLIEDLEQNLSRIRYKRQLLLDPRKRPGFLTDEPADKTYENYNRNTSNEDDIDWTERLFSSKPSLQNIENIIANQRRNLEALQNQYRNKRQIVERKGGGVDYYKEYSTKEVGGREKSSPNQVDREEVLLLKEKPTKDLPELKKKHQELTKEFKSLLRPETVSVKVKPPKTLNNDENDKNSQNDQKNDQNRDYNEKNYEDSPTFGKNREFNRKVQEFRVGKALKTQNEGYFKQLQKKEFDNWRKEENYEKKTVRESLERSPKPGVTDLPIKKNEFYEKKPENPEKSGKKVEIEAKKRGNRRDLSEIQANRTIFGQIFVKIDVNSMGIVSKQEVFNYLSTDEKLFFALDLDKPQLFQFLDDFNSKRVGLLTKSEFIDFLEKFPKITEKKEEFKRKNTEIPKKKPKTHEITEKISVNTDILDIMQQEFIDLDKFEDFIVKKPDFFKKLRESPSLMPYSDSIFLRIQPINKTIRLREVIDFLMRSLVNTEGVMQNKEFISWAEFLSFFKDETRILMFMNSYKGETMENLRIDSDNLELLRDLFGGLRKVVLDFAETADFVMEAKKDPLVKGVLGEKAREYETIGEFLDRLMVEAAEYIDWNDVLAFLGERGRPREYVHLGEDFTEDKGEKGEKAEETVDMNKEINRNDKKYKEEEEINKQEERYDLEEEENNGNVDDDWAVTLKKNQQKTNQGNYSEELPAELTRPPMRNFVADRDVPRQYKSEYHQLSALDRMNSPPAEPLVNSAKNLNENSPDPFGHLPRKIKKKPSLTVPKGPSFLIKPKPQTIRQRKLEQIVEESRKPETEALKFKFRANEVPEAVKLPKFDNMMLNEAEKKLKRGKNQITEAKPFNFQAREEAKAEQKKGESKDSMASATNNNAFQFKAREIPQSCKNLMFEDLEKKATEERKQRFEARKEENLKALNAFQRMEEAEKLKRAKEEERKTKTDDRFNYKPDLEESKKTLEKLRKEGVIKEYVREQKENYLDEDNKREGTKRPQITKAKTRTTIKEDEEINKEEDNNNKGEEDNKNKGEEDNNNNEEDNNNNEEDNNNNNEEDNNNKDINNKDDDNERNAGVDEIPKAGKKPKTANADEVSVKSSTDLKSKTDGFQHKMTKKQIEMKKLKEKEALEKKAAEEQKKKELEEKKAKEEEMKRKVQEKFKVEPKPEKPKIKKNDDFEKNYEEEKRKLAEKMAKKPLMVEDAFHKSKAVSRYKNLIGKVNLEEEKEGDQKKEEDNGMDNYDFEAKLIEESKNQKGKYAIKQDSRETSQISNEKVKESAKTLREDDEDNAGDNNEMKEPSAKNEEQENDIEDDDFEAKLLDKYKNQKGKLNILQETRETSQIKKAEALNPKAKKPKEESSDVVKNTNNTNPATFESKESDYDDDIQTRPIVPVRKGDNERQKKEVVPEEVSREQEENNEEAAQVEENQVDDNKEEEERREVNENENEEAFQDNKNDNKEGNNENEDAPQENNNDNEEAPQENNEPKDEGNNEEENAQQENNEENNDEAPKEDNEEIPPPQENNEEEEKREDENEEEPTVTRKPLMKRDDQPVKINQKTEDSKKKPIANQDDRPIKIKKEESEADENEEETAINRNPLIKRDDQPVKIKREEPEPQKDEEKVEDNPEEINEELDYANDFESEDHSPTKILPRTPTGNNAKNLPKETPKIPLKDNTTTKETPKIPTGEVKETPKVPKELAKEDIPTKEPKKELTNKAAEEPAKEPPKKAENEPSFLAGIPKNSKLYAALSACASSNKQFEDPEFPAAISSLCKDSNDKHYNDFKKVQWVRPEKLFASKNYKLFDKIEPNDIMQGSLGDCYFLATCSAIAEFPERVQAIFLNKTANDYGAYSVIYYFQGIPVEILVDDRIPCREVNGKFESIFTKPVGMELWVMLLEKAWAKAFKCYSATEGWLPDYAMEHILGFPAKGFNDKRESDKKYFQSPQEMFALLRDSDKKNYVMCAGSKGQGEEQKNGIVSGHAYTIISCYEKLGDSILKMRNPWGGTEWKGKYREDSALWDQNPNLKKELGMVKADDGVFFMTVNEFLNEFNYVGICYVQDMDWELVHQEGREKSALYQLLEVKQKGDFQLAIHQKLDRIAEAEGLKDYKYSSTDLEVFKMNSSEKIEEMLACGDCQRCFGDSSILVNDRGVLSLAPGKYLIRAKVYWIDSYFKSKSFTGMKLTLRTVKGTYDWKPYDKIKARGIAKEFFKVLAEKDEEKTIFDPQQAYLSEIWFPKMENERPRLKCMYVKNNEKKLTFNLTLTIFNWDNLSVKKEAMKDEKEYKLKIPPGGDWLLVCKIIQKNGGCGCQVKMGYGFSEK